MPTKSEANSNASNMPDMGDIEKRNNLIKNEESNKSSPADLAKPTQNDISNPIGNIAINKKEDLLVNDQSIPSPSLSNVIPEKRELIPNIPNNANQIPTEEIQNKPPSYTSNIREENSKRGSIHSSEPNSNQNVSISNREAVVNKNPNGNDNPPHINQSLTAHNILKMQTELKSMELDQLMSDAKNINISESTMGKEVKAKMETPCSQLAHIQYLEMAANKLKTQITSLTEENLELKVQNMQFKENYKGLEEEVEHLQSKIRSLESENASYHEIKGKMERLNKEILEKNGYIERYVTK